MTLKKLSLALASALILFGCSSSDHPADLSSSSQNDEKMYSIDEYNSVFASQDSSAAS